MFPRIATLLVEGDPASAYYAQAKQKIAAKLGVEFALHAFPANVSQEEVLALIASPTRTSRIRLTTLPSSAILSLCKRAFTIKEESPSWNMANSATT
ncbi:tetrahydrofolate dehydrogenase/cyclohydrolase catalytic domain-containing protein [Cohnella fermenti]|uniref:tetrahydrofolate dehydrogenase/cyclohydrolase catalytic domain-containing protein n=1 Tax=Cohnella fermenti TaxID=2565925 RepID=UPI0022AAC4D8|nr:tetrahydrofolate dehydrogenase/cyclohydrolase catalytic domain-containing protein [Cohnella fermenti]